MAHMFNLKAQTVCKYRNEIIAIYIICIIHSLSTSILKLCCFHNYEKHYDRQWRARGRFPNSTRTGSLDFCKFDEFFRVYLHRDLTFSSDSLDPPPEGNY